mgnify:CR=1 FL=1
MIQFNLTLPVQLFNFVVTFYVLKRFLFAPVIERIIRRKKEEKQLCDEIILKKQDVENFRSEKTTQLSQFQKDAKTDFPFAPVKDPAPALPIEPVTIDPPEDHTYEKLAKEVERKVRHGH